MKTSLLVVAAVLAGVGSAFAQQDKWTTDLAKAETQAKAENKAILLDFTGSDWCGWCMKMKKEALDTPQFSAYADKNLVLMTVDFPRSTPLPPEVKQQNDKLSAQYRANGFPTFILINGYGRELGRQDGYLEGGANAFIAKLNTFYHPAPKVASKGGDDFDTFFKKPAVSQ